MWVIIEENVILFSSLHVSLCSEHLFEIFWRSRRAPTISRYHQSGMELNKATHAVPEGHIKFSAYHNITHRQLVDQPKPTNCTVHNSSYYSNDSKDQNEFACGLRATDTGMHTSGPSIYVRDVFAKIRSTENSFVCLFEVGASSSYSSSRLCCG